MRLALAACVMLSMLGCAASAKPAAEKKRPLTAEQTRAYDHGVDFVASLEGIEGRWRDDWDRDLSTRVSSADLIAVVTIRTLRTDSDPEHRVTYRLLGHVDQTLLGDVMNEEVELLASADQVGFSSVHQNQGRLAGKQFVAYVKRGPEGLHWHLAPASDQVMLETESRITQLKSATKQDDGERVLVHTN